MALLVIFLVVAVVSGESCSGSSSKSLLQTSKVDGTRRTEPKAMVFYTLFAENAEDVPRVLKIVDEQISLLDPERHELWVNSIGAIKKKSDLPVNPVLAKNMTFVHYKEGQEPVTLHNLWSYCRRDDVAGASQVVYLHAKGSFHNKEFQDDWRRYLTAGALAEECRTAMPEQCNVCSSRMSPVPYPHTPGNMWAARCSYVRKLTDPMDFEHAMHRYQALHLRPGTPGVMAADCPPQIGCWGLERLASEHWIQAHPEMKPCDLDNQQNYTWGTPKTENLQALVDFGSNKVLKVAPRFPPYAFVNATATCGRCGLDLRRRFVEYDFLYKLRPSESWWGWKFFTNTTYGE